MRKKGGIKRPQRAFVKKERSRVVIVPTTQTAYVARKELREPEKTRKKATKIAAAGYEPTPYFFHVRFFIMEPIGTARPEPASSPSSCVDGATVRQPCDHISSWHHCAPWENSNAKKQQ